MNTLIKTKLDKIDELFPKERLDKSKKRWERLWNGEQQTDRMPFVFTPITFNLYNAVHTPSERLEATLNEIICRGFIEDDFIPSIFPGCHTGTIPSMFGAAEAVLGDDRSGEKIIFNNDDIDNLPEPSLKEGTAAHNWLVMQEYFIEQTDGRLPVHVTDMQGPADVCGQLWGYDNFLASAYTDPDYYHKLMDKVTDAFILLWERQQKLCGDLFVGTHLFGWNWLPPNMGASLSADSLVMISPAFFDEFYKPYLQRISDKFGGISVHSCGDFSAVIPSLCNVRGIKAVNAGQMSIKQLAEAGVHKDIIITAFTDMQTIKSDIEYIKQNSLKVDLSIDGLAPNADPESWTKQDYDYMKEQVSKVAKYTAI